MSEVFDTDIVIIGAGPAGLFAAISALEQNQDAHVMLIEHQKKIGRKLLSTGGGQCNFTHGGSIKDFIEHYGAVGPKIRKVLYAMSNSSLRTWFFDHGLDSIERPDGKVFPRSLAAGDVLKTLREAFEQLGGEFLLGVEPLNFHIGENMKGCTLEFLREDMRQSIHAKKCIIATGGITYPKTGSDGSFVELIQPEIERYGISIRPLSPALTPLYPSSYPFSHLEGFSMPVNLWFENHKVQKGEAKGLLFRTDSFSGPAAMDASAHAELNAEFSINFIPFEKRSSQDVAEDLFQKSRLSKKEIHHFFVEYFKLPTKLIRSLLEWKTPVSSQKIYARDISKAECVSVSMLIMHATFTVEKLGSAQEGMVSRGGFAIDDIALSTLSLKKAPCVYVAGECVDVTGDTGGYNLQWAFSSGYVAGKSAAMSLSTKE